MRILLAGEDDGHRIAVTTLTDRLITERVEWARDALETARTWCDDEGRAFVALKTAAERARARRFPMYGHFNGEPGAPDAAMWRAVFFLAAAIEEPVHVVVAARDSDGDERRATGLEQATAEREWPFRIVAALAIEVIEAWFLAAYEPADLRAKERLEALVARLGVDPRRKGHLLKRKTERDPKRAVADLELELHEEGADALRSAPWSTLRERGAPTGLRAFLDAMNDALRDQFPEGRDEPW